MKDKRKTPNLEKFKTKILDVFFPRHNKCIFCDEELGGGEINDCCLPCLRTLPFIKNPCSRCGGSMREDETGVCLNCSRHNFYFDLAKSVFDYDGAVRLAIQNYKYNAMKFLSEPFSNFIWQVLKDWNVPYDIITFVPMHPKKQKIRGYNQAELLALDIGNKSNKSCLPLLEKVEEGTTQTALSFEERRQNVQGSFRFNNAYKNQIKSKSILLIDDVFTTGATSSELSKVLKEHGAKQVFVFTLAHTKLKSH